MPYADIGPEQPLIYEIRLQGHLGHQWNSWFDELNVTLDENGETCLTGRVVDQAALYGILKKVRDIGLPLLAVNSLPPASITDGEAER